MPLPLLVAAGASIAIKAGSAYLQKRQADKKASDLEKNRPVLKDSPFTQDQLALAENELSRGENTASMRGYNQGLDNDFSSSLNAILKNGGDVNDVGSLFNGSQQARQRARLMSENVRLNNVNRFISASQNSDTQRQQQFQFNQYAPWADAAQANSIARQNANARLWQSVDDAGSLLINSAANSGDGGGSADSSLPVSSSKVDPVAVPQYTPPSVSGKFSTIDPNALNNWNGS